jgi:RNA polymerase sigma-70 factor (ECF subfamily)
LNPLKQEVFMELYTPVHVGFLKYCRALTGNHEDALDLAGETILVVLKNLDKLRKQDSFKSYLFGVARRLRLHDYRRIRFRGVFDQKMAEMLPDRSSLPDAEYDIKLIYSLLDRLPTKQRETFVLFELSGFSLEEIRQLQGGTLSAVKMRLKRGREQLRHWLKPSVEKPQTSRQGQQERRKANED